MAKILQRALYYQVEFVKLLGKIPPNGFAYELFLDEKGEKISKSKGKWNFYRGMAQICLPAYLYLCIQILKEQKKLYAAVVPKTVDDYLALIEKFSSQEIKRSNYESCLACAQRGPPKEKNCNAFFYATKSCGIK